MHNFILHVLSEVRGLRLLLFYPKYVLLWEWLCEAVYLLAGHFLEGIRNCLTTLLNVNDVPLSPNLAATFQVTSTLFENLLLSLAKCFQFVIEHLSSISRMNIIDLICRILLIILGWGLSLAAMRFETLFFVIELEIWGLPVWWFIIDGSRFGAAALVQA
jgi:hypothetical protein